MRVFAGALLAVLASGPDVAGSGNVAVTLNAQPLARSCAVVSIATITTYDARTARDITYRFVRSDGTLSRTRHLTLAGEGAVAQSVRDTWNPRGDKPWVALDIIKPEPLRSHRVAAASSCPRRVATTAR